MLAAKNGEQRQQTEKPSVERRTEMMRRAENEEHS